MTPLDRLLHESRLEFLRDKYRDKVDESTLNLLMAADPTSRNEQPGGYADWIIRGYLKAENKKIYLEDLYKTTDDLKVFDQVKLRLPAGSKDINKLTTKSLYELVKPFTAEVGEKERASTSGTIPGAELVYQDSAVKAYKLLTYEASVKLGRGTRWCTAADSEEGKEAFNDYTSGNQLVVIVFTDGAKYQFGASSSDDGPQFKDKNDSDVDFAELAGHCNPQFLKFLSQIEGVRVLAAEKNEYGKVADSPVSQDDSDEVLLAYISGAIKTATRRGVDHFLFKLLTNLAQTYPGVKAVADLYRRALAGETVQEIEWKSSIPAKIEYSPDTDYYGAEQSGIRNAYDAARAAALFSVFKARSGVSGADSRARGAAEYAKFAGLSYQEQVAMIQGIETAAKSVNRLLK